MRIKNLKAKNIYNHGKDLNMSLNEQENIILIRQPNDENSFIPFIPDFLEIVDFLLFNDSYTYVKNMLSNQSLIECTLERKGVEYTFGIKGNCSEKAKDGCVRKRNVLDWYCIVPEKELQGKNGGWLEAQLCCDAQEYFYPKALESWFKFDKDNEVNLSANLLETEIGLLNTMARYNRRDFVSFETEIQKLIQEFHEIKINDYLSIGLNKDKEYVLLFHGEEMTQQKDLDLVNFCGWINNLKIFERLYRLTGENGNLPVFIDGVFDGVLAEHKQVLIERLRETGRQVFIISRKRDEEMEKLCDKVLVLN